MVSAGPVGGGGDTRIPGVEGPGDTGADGVELQDVTDALFQGRGWGQGGGSAQPASSFTGNSPCLLPAGSKTGQDSCS